MGLDSNRRPHLSTYHAMSTMSMVLGNQNLPNVGPNNGIPFPVHAVLIDRTSHLCGLLWGYLGNDRQPYIAVVSLCRAGPHPEPSGPTLEAICCAHTSPILRAERSHTTSRLVGKRNGKARQGKARRGKAR